MSQSAVRSRTVGDYLVSRKIGSGSFSVVWHARHRVHGTEVAIKEIATNRLNRKLHESLMSEISILQRINHPNIIRLHDIIECRRTASSGDMLFMWLLKKKHLSGCQVLVLRMLGFLIWGSQAFNRVPGKIHLVLEYCRGGDLSMYIQHHGRVLEEIAKYFMQQLATGLHVLRENNLIHRDLKPQNLLLVTRDERPVLKIADFGFARSLQPRGLAETLCGSPLYMAPEIMQLQKYDAKADLWSVGAILYQLVTGKTPYTGNTQIQLLQNIIKSNELHFPPESRDLSLDCKDLCQKLLRRNPVERLTFEEFFNHSFLFQRGSDDSCRNRQTTRSVNCYPLTEHNLVKTGDSSHDECFPFILEDEGIGSCGSSSSTKIPLVESSKGFIREREIYRKVEESNTYNKMYRPSISRYSSSAPVNKSMSGFDILRPVENRDDPLSSVCHPPSGPLLRVEDSLELIKDYVIVSGSPMDVSSHSESTSQLSHNKQQNPLTTSANIMSRLSAVEPGISATAINAHYTGSLDSCGSAHGASLVSSDLHDVLERPSTHCMTRIKSLQQCSSAIKELVNEKLTTDRQLEAFSIQLVILAIWKQALDICHTQAASAMEGSSSHGTSRSDTRPCNNQEGLNSGEFSGNFRPEDVFPQIEGEFLREVENAENLAKFTEHECMEMPDAMEMIFQSALILGRRGGVEDLMGDAETAALLYSKAAHLLVFLLVEAPSLILNPPFSLTSTDRYRLRSYIEILNRRQGYLRSNACGISQVQRQAMPHLK
ncbi:hypothetical protein SAY86_030709 [Trapa natans]|uniref:Protein kinase domain-containing protein n=1 Tax=Trapa natans TaxID=22666 RepID=A0AAN7MSQ5_TRANT|nr:hypothetical protein SAY86_030709 [Trapa natans]